MYPHYPLIPPITRDEIRWFSECHNFENALRSIRMGIIAIWNRPYCIIIEQFTDHSLLHSLKIIEKISELERYIVKDDRSLNEFERFVLMAGIYLHDIGMQCTDITLLKKHGIDTTLGICNLPVEEQLKLRKVHNELSAEWINKIDQNNPGYTVNNELRIAIDSIPNDLIGPLATICKYHSGNNNINAIQSLGDVKYMNLSIRTKLLATLLRLGDELDTCSDKINIDKVKTSGMQTERAVYFWEHYYTNLEVKSTRGGSGKISLAIELNDNDYRWYNEALKKRIVYNFYEKNQILVRLLSDEGFFITLDDNNDESIKSVNKTQMTDDIKAFISPVFYHLEKAFKENYETPNDAITDKLFTNNAIIEIEEAYRLFLVKPSKYTLTEQFNLKIEYARLNRFIGKWLESRKLLDECDTLLKDPSLKEQDINKAYYHLELGSLIFELGEITDGIEKLFKAKDYANSALCNDQEKLIVISKILKALGNTLREQAGRSQEAEEYLMLGLGIFKNLVNKNVSGYRIILSDYYREIGNLYSTRNANKIAEEYYIKALEEIKDIPDNPVALHLMGIILYHQAKTELRNGEYDKGKDNLIKSYNILRKYKNPIRLSFIEDALGSVLQILGDLSKAEKYYNKALKIRKDFQYPHFKAYTLHNLARLYLKTGEINKAESNIEAAILIWGDLIKFDRAEAYFTYGRILEKNNNINEALEKYKCSRDSFKNSIYKNDPNNEKVLGIEHIIKKLEYLIDGRELELGDFEYLIQAGEYSAHTWLEKDNEINERLNNLINHNNLIKVEIGIGDDAAVIKPKMTDFASYPGFVFTTDAAPGSICRSDNIDAAKYAAKFSVIHSISDLLAMGATPVAVLLNLYLKRDAKVKYVKTVIDKVTEEAARYNAILIGGDIKERTEQSIGCVGIGIISADINPLRRSGAKPGQIVAISLAGFKNINNNNCSRKIGKRWVVDYLELLNRKGYLKPGDRLQEKLNYYQDEKIKQKLLFLPYNEIMAGARTNKISSAIDTSDGVMSCLEILARESSSENQKLAFVLEEDRCNQIIDDEVKEIAEILNINPVQFLFNAGHDWEIVMTLDQENFMDVRKVFQECGGDLAPLGKVVKNDLVNNNDYISRREIGFFKNGHVYKIPIFTDEKFVNIGYEDRINEWEDLDLEKRLSDTKNIVDIEYKPIEFE